MGAAEPLEKRALTPEEDVATGAAAHAGFWPRVVAALIDSLILCVLVVGPTSYLFTFSEGEYGAGDAFYALLVLVVPWLYFAGMESGLRQATWGKRLMRLQVTGLDGAPLGFRRATARYFAKILSALPLMLGFLIVPFTGRRQALHDLLAGTLVVVEMRQAPDNPTPD